MNEKRRKYDWLQFYRTMATLFVMLYHWTTAYNDIEKTDWKFQITSGGVFGVGLLFMLTGFFAMQSIDRRVNPLEYLKKRIARIYPTYAICIIISTAVLFALLPEYAPSLKQVLLNFTMLQKLFGVSGVDGAYWTLSIQILFWTFIAIMLRIQKTM